MGRGEVGINWYNYDLSYHFLAQSLNLELGMDPLILFDKEEVLWETIIKVGDKRTLYFT